VLQEKPTYLETDVGRKVRIAYTNGCGQSSIRVIEPRRIFRGGNGYTYIRAWCHLRAEERTFRLDRVRSWEPIGTGAGQTSHQPSEQHAAPIRKKQPISPAVYIHHATLTNCVYVELCLL
jgi:predicted DNA-binding transcriptional regulator YafY